MKDDVYLIIEDGWKAKVDRIIVKGKDKGWTCELIPKELVINRYLSDQQTAMQEMESELESLQAKISEYEEENGGDEGILSDATNDKGKFTKSTVTQYMREIKGDPEEREAYKLLQEIRELFDKESDLKKEIKQVDTDLDAATLKQYGKLTEDEVRSLVIDDKWLASIQADIQSEIDSISQRLTSRIKELAERYEHTLTELDQEVSTLEDKVSAHLKKMGLVWN